MKKRAEPRRTFYPVLIGIAGLGLSLILFKVARENRDKNELVPLQGLEVPVFHSNGKRRRQGS